MLVKYLSHGAANSPEFRFGAPAAWPRVEERVPDGTVLTPAEVAAGFTLITLGEMQAIVTAHKSTWDLWVVQREALSQAEQADKRAEVVAAFAQLRSVADPNNQLTADEVRIAVKIMAKLMLYLEDPLTKS